MTCSRTTISPVSRHALLLSGCATALSPLPYMRGDAALRTLDATGAGKITHIVYIVQENRSFDNLFRGYPGADTVSSGQNSKVRRSRLCR